MNTRQQTLEQISDLLHFMTVLDGSRKIEQLAFLKLSKIQFPGESQATETALLFLSALPFIHKAHHAYRQHLGLVSSMDTEEYHWLLTRPVNDLLLLMLTYRYQAQAEVISKIINTPKASWQKNLEILHEQFAIDFPKGDLPKFLQKAPKDLADFAQTPKQKTVKTQSLPKKMILETSVVLLVLFLLSSIIPKTQSIYNEAIQSKLNGYLAEKLLTDSPEPKEITHPTPFPEITEVATEEDETPANGKQTQRKDPKVSQGEVWRFSFTRGDSEILKEKVSGILSKYSIKTEKPSVVPGGIQFDVLSRVSDVIPIKKELEALIQKDSSITLSWYKKKKVSNRVIPENHVQMILWISTL